MESTLQGRCPFSNGKGSIGFSSSRVSKQRLSVGLFQDSGPVFVNLSPTGTLKTCSTRAAPVFPQRLSSRNDIHRNSFSKLPESLSFQGSGRGSGQNGDPEKKCSKAQVLDSELRSRQPIATVHLLLIRVSYLKRGLVISFQRAMCSLILAAALILPGPALAEEPGKPSVAANILQHLLSQTTDADRHRKSKPIQDLMEISIGLKPGLHSEMAKVHVDPCLNPYPASKPHLPQAPCLALNCIALPHIQLLMISRDAAIPRPISSSSLASSDRSDLVVSNTLSTAAMGQTHRQSKLMITPYPEQTAAGFLQNLHQKGALDSHPSFPHANQPAQFQLQTTYHAVAEASLIRPTLTSTTIACSFSQLGSVAGPVYTLSQRPKSSLLGTPLRPLQNRHRALHRKTRRTEVSVSALPGVNQAVNQGVNQVLGQGAGQGFNQFAELAAASAKKAFNVGVLGATAGASLKLFTVCALVVWMQKSGWLPETTPAVLSQVAFRLLIPCFLMSKVATTLYTDFSPSLLAIPVVAVAQILLGAGMGRVAAHFAYRQPALVPAHFEEHQPTRASSVVAASVALATGQPDVAVVLTAPKGVGTAKLGASKEALMTATSAFGNSLTLPLVFLSALLDRAGADKAAGYLALYMVGWSPALWTFGYNIIAGTSNEPDGEESDYEGQGRWQNFLAWLGRIMNPPLYGVLLGLLIGTSPLAHLFLPPPSAAAETLANATSISPLTVLSALTSGILRPVMEAASLLGTATLAVQTVVLASSLAASMPTRQKSLSTASRTFTSSNVINPNPLTEVLRESEGPVVSAVADAGTQRVRRRRSAQLKEGPDPANMLDGRAVWVVSGVRLLLLPLVNLFLTLGLMRAHILPADPLCGLVLMAEAAMPSAQNLVLLAQLNTRTRPLAGMVAGLLLRQYALSILPITFWMAIFLSVLGIAK